MKKEIICIVCPLSCHIVVEGEGENIASATGYGCKRGLSYATAEFAHPMRLLTTTVRVAGTDRDLLPVRSSEPLPKEKLFDCMSIIREVTATAPVQMHQVLVSNICNTGVDIVATKAMS